MLAAPTVLFVFCAAEDKNELVTPLTRVTEAMLVPAEYTQAYPVWPWLLVALLACVARPEMPRFVETVDACGQLVAVPPPDDPAPALAELDAPAAEALPPAAAVEEDCELHPASRPTAASPIRADVVIRMFSERRATVKQILRIWRFIYIMFGNIQSSRC